VSATAASFRDPENAAFCLDGAWYRIAAPASAAALRTLLDSPVGAALISSGALLPFEPVEGNRAQAVIDAYAGVAGRAPAEGAEVFAVETAGPITYPWEWPNSLLASAALLTLQLREQLLGIGLDLKDASAFNVQFRGMQPVFIDVGSIEAWRPNPSWNASRQFIEHFVNPLAVGSGEWVTAADAWAAGRRRGLRSEAARQMLPKRQRRRLSLRLLQATTRPVAENAPIETRNAAAAQRNPQLALSATRSLTRRLRKQIDAVQGAEHSTTWHDYSTREHYGSDDLGRKRAFVTEFAAPRGELVLDVGGNDGMTAAALVEAGASSVIVLDSDAGALDVLHSRLSGEGALTASITPLLGDVTNLTPASGLLDGEFAAFTDRVRPSAVTCQAVLHHVVITQGTPMQLAVDALARFGAPLQIEFATPEDEKVRLLLRQIPNWSGDYSTEALMAALTARYADVHVVGQTSPTRIVVNATGLRG
jgi:ribosomal protein L11 methylase PrmA